MASEESRPLFQRTISISSKRSVRLVVSKIFVSAQISHIWVIVHICGADPDHLGAGAQQDLDCPPLQELNDKRICILVGFGLDRRHCRLGSRLDLRASVPMCDAHALGYHWPLSEPGEFVVDPLPVEIFLLIGTRPN
jgi:hypothetical protein